VQVVGSKYRLDAVDSGVEVAGTAGAFEGGPQLAMGELGSIRRGGRNGQNRACVGTSESTVGLMLERQQGGRVVLPQVRTQLVHELLTVPYRVLLPLSLLRIGGCRYS
jgi:hypothetical protein